MTLEQLVCSTLARLEESGAALLSQQPLPMSLRCRWEFYDLVVCKIKLIGK